MRTLVLTALGALLVAGPVRAEEKVRPVGEKVQIPEGWYRVEPEGQGGEPLAAIFITDGEPDRPAATGEPLRLAQAPEAAPPPEKAPPPAAPTDEARPLTPREEVEQFQRLDCEEVRGKYLERLLELHGMSAGQLPQRPRDLGVWTRHRRGEGPPTYAQIPWPLVGDPALAPLYGLPPIPPGAIAWDFTLRNLAEDLLKCERLDHPQPPPKYPPPEELLDRPVPQGTSESVTPATPHET